jgi:2-phospho-L-lactate/phosphoenolpyruvate guanylyltransferase
VNPLAVIPVKRFGAAKQRLRAAVPDEAVAPMATAMLADLLAALARCERVAGTIVVSGEPSVAALAAAAGAEPLDDPADAGHSQAALLGVARARARGAGVVALLPGDCPLLEPAELDAALAGYVPAGPPRVGIVPDRHGEGTNALLLRPPTAISPAFGPGSRRRHGELAAAAGIESAIEPLPSLALDLDTPDDLAELRARLDADPGLAPRTARALAGLTPAPPTPLRR